MKIKAFLVGVFLLVAFAAFSQSTPPTGPIKTAAIQSGGGGGGGTADCQLVGDANCQMIGAVRSPVAGPTIDDPVNSNTITLDTLGITFESISGGLQVYDEYLNLFDSAGVSVLECDSLTPNDYCKFGVNTPVIAANQFQAKTSAAASPGYSFEFDPNTGIANIVPDTVSFVAGGVDRFSVQTSEVNPTVPIRGLNGSASSPSFSFQGDPNTGIFENGADTIGFAANGSESFRITTTAFSDQATTGSVNITRGAGSASSPIYSFAGDTNMGLYRSAADTLMIALNGANELSISSTVAGPAAAGGLSLGTTSLPFSTVNLQTGSAGTPSVTMGDTNSGIFGGADILQFSTGGTMRVSVANGDMSPSANDTYDLGTSGLGYNDVFVGTSIQGTGSAKALIVQDTDGVQISGSTAGNVTLTSNGKDLSIDTNGVVRAPLQTTTTYTAAFRFPGSEYTGGGVSAPTCDSSNPGKSFYVDRTDDAVDAAICVCIRTGAGSYTLRRIDDLTTACDAVP